MKSMNVLSTLTNGVKSFPLLFLFRNISQSWLICYSSERNDGLSNISPNHDVNWVVLNVDLSKAITSKSGLFIRTY